MPLDNVYLELKTELNSMGISVSPIEFDESGEQGYIYKVLNDYTRVCAALLSVFNCITISSLWIKRRRKEFFVQKAFGYTMGQIADIVIKYFFKLFIITGIITCILQVILYQIMGKRGYFEHITLEGIAAILALMMIVFFLAIIEPMIEINRINPARGIQDR